MWSMSARLFLKLPKELWLESASKVVSDHKKPGSLRPIEPCFDVDHKIMAQSTHSVPSNFHVLGPRFTAALSANPLFLHL